MKPLNASRIDAPAFQQKMLCLLLAGAFAGSVSPALADEDSQLSHVVVSASKIEQSTAEAPSNVSVITSSKIENSNAIRLGDVLTAQVPALYLRGGAVGNTSRDAGSSIISLRGAYGARTKVVIDGVASLADANSGNLNLSTVGLGDVDRIEVVPGVSSSLYGSDAIGGVINVITKAPTKREFNAGYTKGFGDGDRSKYEIGYRDRFESGLGVSFSYYRQEMEGYAKNDFLTVKPTACGTCTTPVSGWEKTVDNTGVTQYIIGDKGAVGSTAQNFNGTFFYDISPDSKVKAGFTYYDSTIGYSPYNLYLNSAAGAVNLPAKNLKIDGKRVANLTEASLSLPGENAKVEKRYFAGYEGKIFNDYLLKLDASHFDREAYYLSKGTTVATTYSGGPGTATHTPNKTNDAQAQLSFPVGDKHFLVAGLAINTGQLNRKVYRVSDWRDDDSKISTTDSADGYTQTNSVFVQDQYSITPATTLYFGARYDNWSTHGKIEKTGNPKVNVDEHEYSSISPRIAAVHKLFEGVALKASMGNAFRAPTLYDLYAADTVSGAKLITSDFSLKPEKAQAWDLGTEINLRNGANIRAAYFHTKITDMIYSKESTYTGPYTASIPVTVNILSQKTNAAEGLTKGIELSGDTPLTRWLRASASYTYTDARITKDDTGTGLLDKKLVFVPKNMASLGLEAKYHQWSANWLSRYSGLTYSNASNSDTEKNVYMGVSKYWVSDLKVSYQIDRNFKASFLVNNVLDKKYYEYYLMPGRNLALQLSASF
jgi:iron complex outermembrane receptor protein